MQTLSELIEIWKARVYAEAKAPLLESAYQRLAEPASILEYERIHREEADQILRRYSRTMNMHKSDLSDEMTIVIHIRLQEGLYFGKYLAESGLGSAEKKAEDWISYLAIDSWYEVLIHKWRFEYRRHYGI